MTTLRAMVRVLLALSLMFLAVSLPAQTVRFTIIQFSDVYEMPGVVCDQSASRESPPRCTFGGLARMATLVKMERQQAAEQKTRAFTILAGGLISPSAFQGVYNGANMVRLAGQNVGGSALIQYAVFGRHEFDLTTDKFQSVLDAGDSPQWFSANLLTTDNNTIKGQYRGMPQPDCQDGKICRFSIDTGQSDSTGKPLKVEIGLIGATVNPSKRWVQYQPADSAVANLAADLRDKVDVLIAVTHQGDDDDRAIANTPVGATIDLILGGHTRKRTFISQQGMQDLPGNLAAAENTGPFEKPCRDQQNAAWTTDKFNSDAMGRRSWTLPSMQPLSQIICARDNSVFGTSKRLDHKKRLPPPIFKGDANGLSAWVHRFEFNLETRALTVTSQIRELAGSLVAPDADMARAVQAEWQRGVAVPPMDTFQLGNKMADIQSPLDATEACIRFGRCSDNAMLAQGLAKAIHCRAENADIAIYHAGAVTLDSLLGEQATPGSTVPMTTYDLLRLMPFKGYLATVEMPIDKVYKAIESSKANCGGLSCYLWFTGATWDPAAKTLTFTKKNIKYPDGKPSNIVMVATNDYLLTNRDQDLVDLTFAPVPPPTGQDWRLVISQNFLKPACVAAEAGN